MYDRVEHVGLAALKPPLKSRLTSYDVTSNVSRAQIVGHGKMNPFCIPFAIANMGSALTAMELGFMGPNYRWGHQPIMSVPPATSTIVSQARQSLPPRH